MKASPLRLGIVVCATALVVLAGSPAAAEVTGPCAAEVAGEDVGARSSTRASDAIEVAWDETLTTSARADIPLTGYRVEMEFAGFRWTVAEGEVSGDSWGTSVDVSDYAPCGVGVYKVIAHSDGAEVCSAAALIKLTGKNPLTTVAGIVGAALLVLGGVGTTANALSRKGIGSLRGMLTVDPASFGPQAAAVLPDASSYVRAVEAVATSGSPAAVAALADPWVRDRFWWCSKQAGRWLFLNTLWVALLTPAMMAAGSPGAGASWGGAFPRIPARPRVSAGGILTGLVAGLGALILLQQFGVLYPTRAAAIVVLAAGAVLNPVLGTVVRARRAARLNAILARAEQRLQERGDTPAPGAAPVPAAGWSATHVVPSDGMQAWAQPDPSESPVAALEAGREVTLRERRGDWALVELEDGWTGWVDARLLGEVDQ